MLLGWVQQLGSFKFFLLQNLLLLTTATQKTGGYGRQWAMAYGREVCVCVCVLCGLREKKLKEGVGRDG